MAALCGLFHREAKPLDASDRALVAAMLARLAHRSPDGTAVEEAGPGCLGQGLFWTSADRPRQRSVARLGGLALVGDLRLDEREVLAQALGVDPAAVSDAELILAAYDRWRDRCVDHLLGDFAFAIVDEPRSRLLAARDHFGIKPVFYAVTQAGLLFASEAKALFASPEVANDWDEESVADFAVSQIEDPARTLFRQIRRLPPRSVLVLDAQGLQIRQYWSPVSRAAPPGVAPEAAFRQLFEQAVACRLVGAASPAVMLSGGLDSSSIAVVAERLARASGSGPLRTLSLVFEANPSLSERPFIDDVLAGGDYAPTFIPVDETAPLAEMCTILAEQDGPFLAPGLAMSRALYHEAARQGVRTLLDGHGGDEAVSHGYGRLGELARAGRWLVLWKEVAGVGALFGSRNAPAFLRYALAFGEGWLPAAGRRLVLLRRRLRPGGAKAAPGSAVSAGLRARTGVEQRRLQAKRRERELDADEARQHADAVVSPFTATAFEVLDRAAAAAGVEARYPFYDKRLVEFCLALPSEAKLSGGWTRFILRKAMDGLLPPTIQWRRDKMNFGPHLSNRMLACHQELLDTLLIEDRAGLSEVFDMDEVRAAYRRLPVDEAARAGAEGQLVWRAATMALWLSDRDAERNARSMRSPSAALPSSPAASDAPTRKVTAP